MRLQLMIHASTLAPSKKWLIWETAENGSVFSAYFPTAFDSKCIDGCSLFGMELFLLLAYGQYIRERTQQHLKNDRDQPRG